MVNGQKCYFKNLKVLLHGLSTICALPTLSSAIHLSDASAGMQKHTQVLLFLIPPHCLCSDNGQQVFGVCTILCKDNNMLEEGLSHPNESSSPAPSPAKLKAPELCWTVVWPIWDWISAGNSTCPFKDVWVNWFHNMSKPVFFWEICSH